MRIRRDQSRFIDSKLFDPFDKLPGTMPGTGRAGRLRALRAVRSKQ